MRDILSANQRSQRKMANYRKDVHSVNPLPQRSVSLKNVINITISPRIFQKSLLHRWSNHLVLKYILINPLFSKKYLVLLQSNMGNYCQCLTDKATQKCFLRLFGIILYFGGCCIFKTSRWFYLPKRCIHNFNAYLAQRNCQNETEKNIERNWYTFDKSIFCTTTVHVLKWVISVSL